MNPIYLHWRGIRQKDIPDERFQYRVVSELSRDVLIKMATNIPKLALMIMDGFEFFDYYPVVIGTEIAVIDELYSEE